ncbi:MULTISPECIES: ABC transporter permease [Intestinimonas]|jgi:peptide/nickel transport system permease protein|uniref:ABC transporter permease n=1 Tax=Intestinimonas TaxID=1392389 RepID=UPI00067F6209|nr:MULTISPECIES: ABC transporter permease [Intestinimonas]MBS6282574.1 ABC transporter permease [Oscillospiraceae bacterium]CUQ46080.1 binding-protein-dependent transport systems inner membrane component [Flavonifractor plautii]SCJ11892.1 Glutathione transport system permease protein gsiD [uncultured Flavonifractor sp.]MCI5563958.1 ABC transporter permease [Intestinimonas massiliensis (ex Afouda et al. 2020)]MDY5339537.1 ABC transporter permease [Intestinimonas sp.]
MKKARNSFFYIGGGISLVMTLLILMGYIWTPYSPTQMDASAQMQAPSLQHLLGTDNFGRDIFSRVLQGAGTSFLIAVSVVAIGCLAGILVGSLCGYYGGTADVILTRVCDSITAFPSILLALVIVSVVGSGTYNIILALGILFIPSFARIVRGEFARCRHLNYIQSAKLMGVGDARILFSHILPNTFSVLLPAITIGFNNAILSEASMSFLGIGIQPPHASLGSMLNDSQTYLRSAPWYALSVGGTIVLLILGFSLLSEGLQQRGRRN